MKSSRLAIAGLAAAALVASARFSGPVSAQGQAKEIAFDAVDILNVPTDMGFGEVAGVATTATGDILAYVRVGGPNATIGASRTYINGGARLYQFDKAGKFLKEIGGSNPNNRPYNFLFAQGVRVDPQGNIWVVD